MTVYYQTAGQIFENDIDRDVHELYDQWKTLPYEECHEQIEEHLISWGYSGKAVDLAMANFFGY